jgi:hypothetical protein
VREAAEGEAPRADAAARHVHHRRHRHQGEGVGGAVAHLAVDLHPARRRRQDDGGDQLAGTQRGLDLGAVAGQAVELGDRDAPPRAVRGHGLHLGIERAHGDRHVGGVGGDAPVAGAEHRVDAVEPLQRGAAGAGLALVAGLGDVVEVVAARPLQQVAAGGGLVAELAGGAGEQRAAEHAVVPAHARVRGEVAVAYRGADAQPAVGRVLHGVERQPAEVDDVRGRLHLQLHQVEQVGAAGDELGARLRGDGARGGAGGRGALVGEGLHAASPAAWRMAATMLG